MLGDVTNALRDDDPVLGQQPVDLVGLSGARLDEPLPGPVRPPRESENSFLPDQPQLSQSSCRSPLSVEWITCLRKGPTIPLVTVGAVAPRSALAVADAGCHHRM